MNIEFLLAVLPCVLIALYIYVNDKKEKEPVGEIFKAFVMGIASIFVTLFISSILGINKLYPNTNDIIEVLIYSFIYIALIEELAKFICSYIFVNRNPNFNYLFDGVVYFTCVSLGFALIENILYAFEGDIYSILLRAVTAIPAHTFFGISSGYYYSLYRKNDNKKYFIFSIVVPILLHGFYDFCILTDNYIFTYIFILFMTFFYYFSINRIKKFQKEDEYIK